MRDNQQVIHQLPSLVVDLDTPTSRPIGMGVAFYGIAAFFVIVFLVIVWVGRIRDRKRGGPRPAPKLPILGRPEDGPRHK